MPELLLRRITFSKNVFCGATRPRFAPGILISDIHIEVLLKRKHFDSFIGKIQSELFINFE